MANDPPFATLNHVAGDLGIPSESALLRFGISRVVSYLQRKRLSKAVHLVVVPTLGERQQFSQEGQHKRRVPRKKYLSSLKFRLMNEEPPDFVPLDGDKLY